MKIHIVRIVLLILIVLCLFMWHKVYTQNEVIYEKDEQLSRAITWVEADMIHQMRAWRKLMHDDSLEIIALEEERKEYNEKIDNEINAIWSWYSENHDIVNWIKDALKDELWLN